MFTVICTDFYRIRDCGTFRLTDLDFAIGAKDL